MTPFADLSSAIRAVEIVAACGTALTSSEWLMNARHLRDDALLSWPISQLRHRTLADGIVPRLLNPVFGYPGILWLVSVRLAAALFLLSGIPSEPARTTLTVVVALTTLAIGLRSPFGLDGSDQMAGFIFGTLALARLFPHPAVEVVFLWVLALQSALAYFTAGYFKLVSPIWRSGAAISGISATRMYGSSWASRFVHGRRWFCVGLAWSIILAECLFPLALVVQLPFALAMLFAGAVFHVMSGVVMGLNTFIWSFLATYPAILWCHGRLYPANSF
jgi:hypothetical protein